MKITSLNIRQGGGTRIDGLFDYLDRQSSDVFLFQEFRDNRAGQRLIKHLADKGFECHCPVGINSTQNTVLIAAKALEPVQLDSPPNQWSIAAARIGCITLFNVYFPQKQEKRAVYDWFLKSVGGFKNTVLIGDFNTGRNDIDLQGDSKFFCESDFRKLSGDALVDVYRHLKGDMREYSWYSSTGNGFRIDHVLCTHDLLSRMHDVNYQHVTRDALTDHSAVEVEISDLTDKTIKARYLVAKLISLIELIENFSPRDRNRTAYIQKQYQDFAYLTPSFDWGSWIKGKGVLMKRELFSLDNFDLFELGKLLLMIDRNDRFNEGYLDLKLEDGTVLQILRQISMRLI